MFLRMRKHGEFSAKAKYTAFLQMRKHVVWNGEYIHLFVLKFSANRKLYVAAKGMLF